MDADNPTVLVITALSIEYAAVRAHLKNLKTLIHHAGTVYEIGEYESCGTTWDVILAETGSGNNIAAIETSRGLDTFRPDIAIFVGVAGGLKYVEIGDVVVADYVYGYESSKWTEKFNAQIKTFGCGYPLVQCARSIQRNSLWRKRIQTDLREREPKALVGPIASGEQVLAGHNTPTHELLEQHCGDTIAVEMEGWGFLFAAHTNGDLPAIVIRGISDLTGGKDSPEDTENQRMAADHAAAFSFELLATLRSSEIQKIKPGRPWRPEHAQL